MHLGKNQGAVSTVVHNSVYMITYFFVSLCQLFRKCQNLPLGLWIHHISLCVCPHTHTHTHGHPQPDTSSSYYYFEPTVRPIKKENVILPSLTPFPVFTFYTDLSVWTASVFFKELLLTFHARQVYSQRIPNFRFSKKIFTSPLWKGNFLGNRRLD